jgi:hypothetical protein
LRPEVSEALSPVFASEANLRIEQLRKGKGNGTTSRTSILQRQLDDERLAATCTSLGYVTTLPEAGQDAGGGAEENVDTSNRRLCRTVEATMPARAKSEQFREMLQAMMSVLSVGKDGMKLRRRARRLPARHAYDADQQHRRVVRGDEFLPGDD